MVVLNWNGGSLTERCLASLERLDHPNHVIVVDNGSDDGSPDRIRAAWPGVVVLLTGTNRGFAGGCNVGIRHAMTSGARFVWLLNNDTVVAPDALTAMVEEMRRAPDVGIVGSVIRSARPPHPVEVWGGGTVNRYLGTTTRFTGPGRGTLDHVVGTSMLVRREVFETVGLLDEAFFFYLEETDLCLRASARGWSLSVAAEAMVLHEGGATVNSGRTERSERADRYHARSTGVFIAKHAGRWALPAATVRLVAIAVRRVLRGQVRRVPSLAGELARGVSLGDRRASEPWPRRAPPLPRTRRRSRAR